MTERRRTSGFLIASAVILIAAAVLRICAFSPGLEYDEIWTMRNYSARGLWTILNDLATPNNHPLNSLFVKWMLLFSDSAWSIRFPSFLAGVATVGLTGWLAVLLFRSRLAALLSMMLVAANPALILYSITARGYAVQTALILLYAAVVVLYYRDRLRAALYLIPVCGLLAELALPTSVLWLFPISLVHCIAELARTKKKWKPLIPLAVSYAVLGTALLAWILLHYNDFKAGQSFGSAIAGHWAFYRDFLFPTWSSVCGWRKYGSLEFLVLLFVFLPFFRVRTRFLFLGLLFVLLVPFAAAVVTLAGPSRVYLATVPLTALAIGGLIFRVLLWVKAGRIGSRLPGWSRGWYSVPALALGLVLAVNSCVTGRTEWTRVDWIDRFDAMKRIPADRFLCVTATGAYPALWNNGEAIVRDYLARFHAMAPGTKFVQLDQRNAINGMNPQGSEDSIPVPDPAGKLTVLDGMNLYSYRLEPYRGEGAPALVLLRMDGIPVRYYSEIVSALAQTEFVEKTLILNAFFLNAAQQAAPERQVCAVIALRVRNDLPSHALFRKFYAANQRKFDFFILSADSE